MRLSRTLSSVNRGCPPPPMQPPGQVITSTKWYFASPDRIFSNSFRVLPSPCDTATRSSTYVNDLYSWVLVEIPEEGSNPATLTATVPGPATAALTGTSTNPGGLATTPPGPPTAAIAGGSSNPAVLDASVPGPPVASIAGGSANPGALDAALPRLGAS